MIMGYGMTNGLEIYVQDQKGGDIETLFLIYQGLRGGTRCPS